MLWHYNTSNGKRKIRGPKFDSVTSSTNQNM